MKVQIHFCIHKFLEYVHDILILKRAWSDQNFGERLPCIIGTGAVERDVCWQVISVKEGFGKGSGDDFVASGLNILIYRGAQMLVMQEERYVVSPVVEHIQV